MSIFNYEAIVFEDGEFSPRIDQLDPETAEQLQDIENLIFRLRWIALEDESGSTSMYTRPEHDDFESTVYYSIQGWSKLNNPREVVSINDVDRIVIKGVDSSSFNEKYLQIDKESKHGLVINAFEDIQSGEIYDRYSNLSGLTHEEALERISDFIRTVHQGLFPQPE